MSLLLAAGLALMAAGTATQYVGQQQAAAASKRAEGERKKQMDLEAARSRRQAVREAVLQTANVEAIASTRGAQFGSTMEGAMAGISNATSARIQGINQGQEIGTNIFKANADAADGQSLASVGAGLSSFGQTIIKNMDTFNRLGTYYGQRN